jgi:hypothetical protein
MVNGTTGTSGDQMPYETSAPLDFRWTLAAFDALQDGTLAAEVVRVNGVWTGRVVGACPRCGHHFTLTRILESVVDDPTGRRTLGTDTALRGDDQDEAYEPLTVACLCEAAHPGGSAQSKGCGIVFKVEILRDAGGGNV